MDKGISALKLSPQRQSLLESMGIKTLEDVITTYPYKYDVIETTYPTFESDKIIIEATVISGAKVFFKGRFSMMSFDVEDQYENQYHVTIFNRHFLKRSLTLGTIVTIIGKCQNNKITASDLKCKPISELQGIHPVYSLKEGLPQRSFQSYVKKCLCLLDSQLETPIPEELLMKRQLIHRKTALQGIHFPDSEKMIKESLKYLKYEEFLMFQLTMQYIKQERNESFGNAKTFDENVLHDFLSALPFTLTTDQQKVIQEILNDLKKPTMMYRFLQGDVGSGKTVVSSVALYANCLAGYQSALMAPTEILAKQHYQTLCSFFKKTSLRIALLTGSLTVKQKEEMYLKIKNGEYDIIVGTHALFQKKVEYHRLGLVVTDEQHRFGVEQRKALKNKGHLVDFLVMSATPIPRTLAMSMYGDMDISTIKTMPQGRQAVKTKFIPSSSMKPILKDLKDYLATGGQCYVICPLVEESEQMNGRSAVQIAEAMSRYFQTQYRVGLLHGQMKDDLKNEVMKDFLDNKIQILVSTTVIEVGVDVKNANMMVIYNAERFGLSQLHQLRGRVGRGNQQAYCYLMSSSDTKEAKERLSFLEQCHDGFEISQYDLQHRGPGEVLGHKQSGLPSFLVADLFKDFPILEIAREDAQFILEKRENDYQSFIQKIKNNLKETNEYID